ncbi:hypothetical protein BV898_02404 [Hypsibius exemplaris]|uniref:Uncharacterized protein n=1 Tax=Hypsibius exemplaris TaxID=2072580 RepID=A0A1W0X8C7_HYPEX|nr:hypothetical protein BV898_02404 [Hypsibius exemplaris]
MALRVTPEAIKSVAMSSSEENYPPPTTSVKAGASVMLVLLAGALYQTWYIIMNPLPSGAEKACGVPLKAPAFDISDPIKLAGVWHVFATFDGLTSTAPPPSTNGFNIYTPVGGFEGSPAGQAVNWTTNFRAGEGNQCMGIFVDAIFTTDGQKNGYVWMTMNGFAKPRYTNAKIIYTDFDTVEIWFQCYVANVKTGFCDVPHIEVNTRQNPNDMSPYNKAAIYGKIDSAVAPFCLTSHNFILARSDSKLPACDVAPPAQFVASLKRAVELSGSAAVDSM